MTTERFSLYGTGKQLNKGDRYAGIFVDILFLCLYLIGMIGWIISAFEMSVQWYVLIPGIVFAACGTALLSNCGKKIKIAGTMVWFFIFFGTAMVFSRNLINGFNLMLNQAIGVLGREFPYMWPFYDVAVSEELYTVTVSLTFIWIAGIVGYLCIYIVKSGNRLLLGMHLFWIFILQIVCRIKPNLFWNVAVIMAILAVWFRSHSEKLPAGFQRFSSVGSLIFISLIVFFVFAVMQIFLPVSTYKKNEQVENWKKEAVSELNDMRYKGSSRVLPDGDFYHLSSFKTSNTPVLKVTMTEPESYYLRGFVGSVYMGTGWNESAAEDRWEYRNLFYWLHKDGYYGQEALSQAAVALGNVKEKNLISIENLNGSSKYYYVPYELYSADKEVALPFNIQKIGDENLLTEGYKGCRVYAYTALTDQVTAYASYAAKLLDADKLNDAGKQYQKFESYYNEFVYKNYLEIPGNLRGQLKKLAGDVKFASDEKHADYSEAKQNIIYILNSECIYQEELKESWNGSDFVADFLTRTKSGYSVHFASAATMLFRYYGIPARYVEGYLITPDDVKNMDANKAYVLDETHAHAWVEYYQDGVGWLPFETTPSYLNVMPKADTYQDISGTSGTSNQEQEIEEEEALDEEEEEKESFDWLLVIEIILLVGIAAFILLFITLVIYVFLLRHRSKKMKKQFESSDRKEAVRAVFSYTMNILAVAGLQIKNTSLYRYAAPIEKMFDEEVRNMYEVIVSIRQEAVYSDHEVTEEQRKTLISFKDMIWKRVYKGSGLIRKFQLKYIYFL